MDKREKKKEAYDRVAEVLSDLAIDAATAEPPNYELSEAARTLHKIAMNASEQIGAAIEAKTGR